MDNNWQHRTSIGTGLIVILAVLASAACLANGKDIIETRDSKRGVTLYAPAHIASVRTHDGPGRWEVYPYIVREDSGSVGMRIKISENATGPDPDFAQVLFVMDGTQIDLLTLAKGTHFDPSSPKAAATFDFGGDLDRLIRQIAIAKKVSLVCIQGEAKFRNEVKMSDGQLDTFRFMLEKYDSLARN